MLKPSIVPFNKSKVHVCVCLLSTALSGDAKAQPYALQQAKALAMTALDVLAQAELAKKIRRQFQEDVSNI